MCAAERIIRLGGTRNLRDVGGYPTVDGRRVRWRTLFRSDCLDRLDLAGQAWLIQAGLRTVIDLRDRAEVAERPNVFARSNQLTYIRFPLWEDPPPDGLSVDLRLGYRREMDLLGERIAGLVKLLASPGILPALVHCAAGKDRTGFSVGVVLAAVGTQPDAIAEDYALTETCLGPEYRDETHQWALSRGYEWSVWEHTVYTPPERMLHTLAYLDESFGGVRDYLLRHGLKPQTLGTLRELLTEAL
jgi:protein tyrosine/serine phosphatase